VLSRLMTRKEQLLLALLSASIVLGSAALYFRGRDGSTPHGVAVATTPAPPTTVSPLPPPGPSPAPPPPRPGSEAEVAPAPPTISRISVAAAGAVRRPGVYELEEGSRVEDLLKAAGGCLDTAELSDVNRAARLVDGTTLTIPVQGTTMARGSTLVLRAAQSAAELNPGYYTLSGWSQHSPVQPPGDTPATPLSPPTPAKEQASALVNINTADATSLEGLPGIGPKIAEEIMRYRSASPFTSVDDLENVPGIGPKKLESVRALVTVE